MSLLSEVLVIGDRDGPRGGGDALPRAQRGIHSGDPGGGRRREERALGEDDAIATHAQLLAEKRIGFFILTAGITTHLTGTVLKSPEGVWAMAVLAAGVVAVGITFTVIWTKVVGGKVREQARRAEQEGDKDNLPEH